MLDPDAVLQFDNNAKAHYQGVCVSCKKDVVVTRYHMRLSIGSMHRHGTDWLQLPGRVLASDKCEGICFGPSHDTVFVPVGKEVLEVEITDRLYGFVVPVVWRLKYAALKRPCDVMLSDDHAFVVVKGNLGSRCMLCVVRYDTRRVVTRIFVSRHASYCLLGGTILVTTTRDTLVYSFAGQLLQSVPSVGAVVGSCVGNVGRGWWKFVSDGLSLTCRLLGTESSQASYAPTWCLERLAGKGIRADGDFAVCLTGNTWGFLHNYSFKILWLCIACGAA